MQRSGSGARRRDRAWVAHHRPPGARGRRRSRAGRSSGGRHRTAAERQLRGGALICRGVLAMTPAAATAGDTARSGSMTGKQVLVTGANTGIGKWTAIGLAELGATVVIHSRSGEKGRAAREEIQRRSGRSDVELVLADFSSLAQVRRLAAEVLERVPRLDVLVNNAGLIVGQRAESADGFELTFAVNHLAPFLLTRLLLDRIVASAPARIVNVASRAHLRGAIDWDDLDSRRG